MPKFDPIEIRRLAIALVLVGVTNTMAAIGLGVKASSSVVGNTGDE